MSDNENTNEAKRTNIQLTGIAKDLWVSGPWGEREKSQRLCNLVEAGHKLEGLGVSLNTLDKLLESGLIQILDSFYREGTTDIAKNNLAKSAIEILLEGNTMDFNSRAAEIKKPLTEEVSEEELVTSELPQMTFN